MRWLPGQYQQIKNPVLLSIQEFWPVTGLFYDVTTRDVSYINKFNYSQDDLIGDITMPLQTKSSHRESAMARDHCYFD